MIPISCLVYAILAMAFFKLAKAVKCKDANGVEADWYYVYKLPKLEDEKHPFNSGLAYAFMTSNDYKNGWTMANHTISKQSSIFGQTLNQLYKDKRRTYSFILYSDQPPTGQIGANYGHTKGVLAMDTESGFWLIHSIPNFPPPISKFYEYPESGRENGQTALCISFKTKPEADKIVNQLLYNHPKIYDDYVENIATVVPNIDKLMEGEWMKTKRSKLDINSFDGQMFISFAKGGNLVEELYADFVAPTLESDLVVATWRRGAGKPLQSKCKTLYQVANVKEIAVKGLGWEYVEDHGKWAITDWTDERKSQKIICIGDINRMESQFKRGGGTVCHKEPTVWNSFKDVVVEREPCPIRQTSPSVDTTTGSGRSYLQKKNAMLWLTFYLITFIVIFME